MDSINTILGAKKQDQEPPELAIIKDFISREFNESCQVHTSPTSIAIVVANGALANMVQMRIHDIREVCDTPKKIYVRIATIG